MKSHENQTKYSNKFKTFNICIHILSSGYCSIIDVYPMPPIYILHSLQGQFIVFQDFTLLSDSKRVLHCCIYDGRISQMFGPKCDMLSKPLRTVSFLGILKKSLCLKL